MTWEELKEKHLRQWSNFMDKRKESMEELTKHRVVIDPKVHSLDDYVNAQGQVEQRFADWQKEWGVDGTRQKRLCIEQSKEVTKFFQCQLVIVRLKDSLQQQKQQTPTLYQ